MPKPHHKKLKYKDSKITLTDRNKSSQLKNDINTYPYNNSNLTEYIKFNKKNSIKSIKNIKKNINPTSRNYGMGFEKIIFSLNFNTSIARNSSRHKLEMNILSKFFNSSQKKFNSYTKLKKTEKNNKLNTHKTLKTSKETSSFSKKEKNYLTTISFSKVNS